MQKGSRTKPASVAVLANVLDHRFRGGRLSAEQHALAKGFADSLGVLPSLQLYLAKEQPFLSKLFEQQSSSYTWWAAGLQSGFPLDLAELAVCLAACEATTASLERPFSTLRHMYGDLRTNLGAEKAGKMALTFRFLNHK